MDVDNDVIKHDEGETLFRGWHLDKRVSVAHLFATLGFAFGLASWQWAEHERVTVLAKDLEAHEQVDLAEKTGILRALEDAKQTNKETLVLMNRQYAEILNRLGRIDDALNRHLENSVQR